MFSSLNVTHVFGFAIDFNGNLRRASSEALYTARHGVSVNFAVAKEGVQIVLESIPPTEQNQTSIGFFPLTPLLSRTVAQRLGWRVNNLIALPLQALKFAQKDTILHVHAPSPVFKPFSMALVKKLSKQPMVLDLHDPWSGHPFPFIGPFETRLRTGLMRCAINSADSVVVAHTALMELVRKINPRKPVNVISNGVDVNLFRPMPRNESIAKKLSISEKDFIVTFSGHVTNEKGLDVLVKSASTILQHHRDVKFLIIGDGPFMKEVKTLLDKSQFKNRFLFTGFIPGYRLPDFLSLADICVAPYTPGPWYEVSRVETPIKVVEYMAMGKPVVMSRISDENVLTWGDGGLLVTPGNASELASNIITLIEDEKLRSRLGNSGQTYIVKEYSWQKITEKLIQIYQSLPKHD